MQLCEPLKELCEPLKEVCGALNEVCVSPYYHALRHYYCEASIQANTVA